MLESAVGFLADADAAQMPAEALAECLRALERADAVEAVARGRFLVAFDAKDGHLADGQRTCRTWLVHSLRVTRGQPQTSRRLLTSSGNSAYPPITKAAAKLPSGGFNGWRIRAGSRDTR